MRPFPEPGDPDPPASPDGRDPAGFDGAGRFRDRGPAGPPGPPGPRDDGGQEIEVVPVVVLSRAFPARPSAIPDIRDFVRACLSRSPLGEDENRRVFETVSQALLDAAGPEGGINVSFRIFPDHVEVDVLRTDPHLDPESPGGWPLNWVDGAAGAASASHAAAAGAAAELRNGTSAGGAPGPGPAAEPAHDSRRPAGVPALDQSREDDDLPFAQWMADVMRRQGLSMEATAGQLGVSVKTVGRWIGGATEPRLRDLRRIRELFGETPLG